MVELTNCAIKSGKLTSHEGSDGPYIKCELKLEADLTTEASKALACEGALADGLPAFTIPKTRIKKGGDKKNPHALELFDGDGNGALAIPYCSVHAIKAKNSGGLARADITVHVNDPLAHAVIEFATEKSGMVGSVRMDASESADPEQTELAA